MRDLIALGHPCIYCGGTTAATTSDHCPPRALFRNRQWPEGFEFPACASCNRESSDDELLVAMLAHFREPTGQAFGVLKAAMAQSPKIVNHMFTMSAREARRSARELGIRPLPGQRYQDVGIATIPEELHDIVHRFAKKLTRAIYFKETHRILAADACIGSTWFTNAQMMRLGRIPLLEAFHGVAGSMSEKTRSGQDLQDQFQYLYSASKGEGLVLLRVVFGTVFGFVTVLSLEPGRIKRIYDELEQKHGGPGPLRFD